MPSLETQPKLYVGCALTHASEEFKTEVEDFKNSLRESYEVLDFVGLEAGTSADVYNWDIARCVKDADAFVAICDNPSTGLGIEMGAAAFRYDKPVLAVAHHDALVTRAVLGMAEVEPNVTFVRYSNLGAEVVPLVAELLESKSR